MATTYSRHTQNYRLTPLPVPTDLYHDESITSWLVRASLNQGCSAEAFTSHYWQGIDLWRMDVDKGFNHISRQIHTDMALLAQTSRIYFDRQNLMDFATRANTLVESINMCNTWVLPLLKVNNRPSLGYYYCPLCFMEDKNAYLRLNWRHSWYVYCHHHNIAMEYKCSTCNTPFQPNLISPKLRYINRCPTCEHKLGENPMATKPFFSNAYELQQRTLHVLDNNEAVIFGKKISLADWFALMRFYINLVRQAARQKDNNHMYFRLLTELDIQTGNLKVVQPDLVETKTNLPFECLPSDERIQLMCYANLLIKIPLENWILACEGVGASQNSFYLNRRKQVVANAFMPVHEALQVYSKQRTNKPSKSQPASIKSVKKSWERLQRKLAIRIDHEQTLSRTKKTR